MKNELIEKLTKKEFGRLLTLETVIKKNIGAAVESWVALAEIRDQRLYREKYKTFEEYCEEKWGVGKRYADMLIKSAAVVKALPPDLRTIVLNPGQARALEKVEPEKRATVLKDAAKSGAVTAKAIEKAAKEEDKPRVVAAEVIKDALGIIVTTKAMKYWERAQEIKDLMKKVSEVKCTIENAQKEGDLLYMPIPQVSATLNMVREEISYALPYTVCPNCNGQLVEKCGLCKGRGVVSKELYSTVPKEVREMRERVAKKGAK